MNVCEEVPVENCQLVTRTVCDGDLDPKPQDSAPSNCKKVVKPSCRIDENCCKKETRRVFNNLNQFYMYQELFCNFMAPSFEV